MAGLGLAMRVLYAGAIIGIAYCLIRFVEYNFYFARSRAPNGAEAAAIGAADALVAVTPGFGGYAARRVGTLARIADRDLTPTKWALEPQFASSLLVLTDALVSEVDTPFLASTIVHEMVHEGQFPGYKGTSWAQKAAYQVQSDFLRQLGIQGTAAQMYRQFPNTRADYITDLHDEFSDYNVRNPAIR